MSPAMSALHEQLVAVKTESDNVRKQLHEQTAKTDQNHHENKIRMRTMIDEVKALKEAKEAEVVEVSQHDNIDVIVSHTLIDGARY